MTAVEKAAYDEKEWNRIDDFLFEKETREAAPLVDVSDDDCAVVTIHLSMIAPELLQWQMLAHHKYTSKKISPAALLISISLSTVQ